MREKDRIYLPFSEAKRYIEEGDVLLYRGRCWYSFFIKRTGKGEYSHAGLASWHNGTPDVEKILETVEFNGNRGGGATIKMENLFPEYSRQIDIYRPNSTNEIKKFDLSTHTVKVDFIKFNGKIITNTMRDLTGLPYGWRRILWFVRRNIFLGRLFYSVEDLTSDAQRPIIYPVCSTAIAYCFSKNDFDLVHERADEWTEPSNLALSPLLNYMFTIK